MNTSASSSDIFEVESINGHRRTRLGTEYLIKWAGYDHSENTWEPIENLHSCLELVSEYRRQCSLKPLKNVNSVSAEQPATSNKEMLSKKANSFFLGEETPKRPTFFKLRRRLNLFIQDDLSRDLMVVVGFLFTCATLLYVSCHRSNNVL